MFEINKKKLNKKCNELTSLLNMQKDYLLGPNEADIEMLNVQRQMELIVVDMKELIIK